MKVFRLFLSSLVLVSVVVCADTIDSIEIVGNERIAEDTIKAKLGVKEGDEFLSDMSSTIINRLVESNFFDDVSIEFDDGLLRVKVVEGLLVSNISFKGNSAVEDKMLKQFLSLKNRVIFSKKKLREDISRIIAMYRAKGYYLTKVIPRIDKKTKGLINIVYEIYEGKEAKITHIRFMGNPSFSSVALKDVIVSKEWRWWALLSSDDVFDEQRVEMDRNALQDFYRNHGYARFKILNVLTELTNDKENFIITFILEEGEKYSFDNVSLTCNLTEVEGEKLAKLVKAKIPHGMSYNPSKISGAELELIDYLAAFGYPFNLIEKDIRLDDDRKTVSVDFSINEGRKVYVNRVDIHNNVRTQDKVIRREMKIGEGDPLNVLNMERSKRSIEGLGFFKGVAVTQADSGIPDKVDVHVNVAERSTGYFNFGGGYKSGSSNGIVIKINFGERNFLGTGRDVALDFERGPMEDGESGGKVDFSITEPYFLGRNLSVGLNVSRADTLRKDQVSTQKKHRKRRNTVGIHAGYNLIEDLNHAIGYRFVSQRFGSKSTEITSQVWQQFLYDKLDSPVDPKDGSRLKFIQSFSGLGGDTKHIEHGIEGKFYSPIFSDDLTLVLSGRVKHIVGYDGQYLADEHRIRVDDTTIRGFETNGIGPRNSNGVSIGGNLLYRASANILFPLGLPEEQQVRGALFLDVASLKFSQSQTSSTSEKDDARKDNGYLRSSAGLSLIIDLPMGKISFNYGIPLAKKSYDKVKRFGFTVGGNI